MKKVIIAIGLLGLGSCDCFKMYSGKVMDYKTCQAIDSVKIIFPNNKVIYSNKEGEFHVILKNAVFGCFDKQKKVEISKNGYIYSEKQLLLHPFKNVTIYLKEQ